ncbi:alpha/beta hydrolase [Dactylosporangium sp. NPDC049140]|uniref:alpha/beta fold hydrolase n=1 Tax=Dactylosporangium sp. NPDC049140 TaxID=3155647 RepID=UPI0033C6CA39
MAEVRYGFADVDGLAVHYREAGPTGAPVLLLLHGYPSAGHMYRDLIPLLADRFRLVAPDLPGFGRSGPPARNTFEHLTDVVDRFTEVLGLREFALYLFDYGAPVGFRLAARHPARVTAIVSQNGNAYEDGLSDAWAPIRAYWRDPSAANRAALRTMLAPETTIWQYTQGAADPSRVGPDGYELDNHYLARPGAGEIQLDLLLDYASNVASYPDFHAYFRAHRPPLLAIWGRNDPFFLPAGAEAFRRDLPGAEVRLLDAGHFALETHAEPIAAAVREFLSHALTRTHAAASGSGRGRA